MCQEIAKEEIVTKISRGEHLKEAMAKYHTLDDDTKTRWELKRRMCLERQPPIKDDIIDILR